MGTHFPHPECFPTAALHRRFLPCGTHGAQHYSQGPRRSCQLSQREHQAPVSPRSARSRCRSHFPGSCISLKVRPSPPAAEPRCSQQATPPLRTQQLSRAAPALAGRLEKWPRGTRSHRCGGTRWEPPRPHLSNPRSWHGPRWPEEPARGGESQRCLLPCLPRPGRTQTPLVARHRHSPMHCPLLTSDQHPRVLQDHGGHRHPFPCPSRGTSQLLWLWPELSL